MNLHEAKTAFLDHLKTQGKSPRTLYTYGKDLDYLITFFGAERDLTRLRVTDMGKWLKSEAYLKTPTGKPRGERTLRKNERTIRQLFVWAKEQGWIESLPLPKAISLGRQANISESIVDD